ncbi:MAG: DUF1735 domain-containing protein [Bacteroidales bacterium]|nr:DUF1735 domain-containing protein [Bacteroidales bacterium]
MKRIFSLILLVVPCILVLSCKKGGNEEEGGTAQLGVVIKDAKEIYEVPEHQSLTLTLSVAANPVSEEGYTITLSADPSLAAGYNSRKGTSYPVLPSEAYSIPSATLMLPRYSAKSTTCEIKLKGEGCETDKVYVLPVAIDGVQGGTHFQAPDELAAYILFKVGAATAEGAGTKESPYIIKSVESFMLMNSLMKDNDKTYFKMTADIDFSDVEFSESNPWTPVSATEGRTADFDGGGHTLSNFKADAGIFSILEGCVHDLTIDGAVITCGKKNLGGIVAGTAGTSEAAEETIAKNIVIRNSSISNNYTRTGSLFGYLKGGVVENVEAACTVSCADARVGGLIGRVDSGSLTNCSASGNVTGKIYYVGGLVGEMVTATVTNCHASVKVFADTEDPTNYSRCGGLIGEITDGATIENCYATGDVQGTKHYGGGLIGVAGGDNGTVTINRCYATGNVTMATGSNWAHAGGLVGSAGGNTTINISNCYATGKIICERYSSGFFGSIYGDNATVNITNSYTTSDVSGINRLFGIVLGAKDPEKKDGVPTGVAICNCSGFIAWNVSEKPFCYPEDAIPLTGNYYGTEGTVSQHATELGWSTDIWDLSSDYPTLK